MQPQEVIDAKTLALIKVLQDKEYLKGFLLAVALQLPFILGTVNQLMLICFQMKPLMHL